MDNLYERVREARRLTGLTQEALALELNVTRGAVAQWEISSGTHPSVENLIALARRSGMAFEYLTTGRGPKIFGEPIIPSGAKTPALSRLQLQLLSYFELFPPRKRMALVEFLKRLSE